MDTANELLRAGERLDDLQLNGLRIIQNPALYCFSSDAVLLADFTRVRAGERVCDLGTGSGIIALLIAAKTAASAVYGVEIQAALADMAQRSVRLNGMEPRVRIINAPMQTVHAVLGCESMDAVAVNPPYRKADAGQHSAPPAIAAARHEIFVTLEEIAASAARLLRFGGRLYIVHQSCRLAELFSALERHNLQPKTLRPVQPTPEKEPHLVLVEAYKGGRPGLKLRQTLIIDQGGL